MPCLSAETLTIEGPDAIAFAHAQLSSDVHALEFGAWQWSAWLDPQGRVRALLQLACAAPDRLHVLLRGGSAAELAQALAPYVLRSRVTVTAQPSGLLVDAPRADAGDVQCKDGGWTFGMGNYAMQTVPAGSRDIRCAWRLAAILAGHPWLPDGALGTLLAPAIGLPELGAVSLHKGCFPGQEIVARLHFRGGCKQHLRRLVGGAGLDPGRKLVIDGKAAGMVLDSTPDAAGETHALAVLRDAAASTTITLDVHGRAEAIRCIDLA